MQNDTNLINLIGMNPLTRSNRRSNNSRFSCFEQILKFPTQFYIDSILVHKKGNKDKMSKTGLEKEFDA